MMADDEDERVCVICTDEMEEDGGYAELDCCEHIFHSECILTWSKRANTCPQCRQSFDLLKHRKSASEEAANAAAGLRRSSRARSVRVPSREQEYEPMESPPSSPSMITPPAAAASSSSSSSSSSAGAVRQRARRGRGSRSRVEQKEQEEPPSAVARVDLAAVQEEADATYDENEFEEEYEEVEWDEDEAEDVDYEPGHERARSQRRKGSRKRSAQAGSSNSSNSSSGSSSASVKERKKKAASKAEQRRQADALRSKVKWVRSAASGKWVRGRSRGDAAMSLASLQALLDREAEDAHNPDPRQGGEEDSSVESDSHDGGVQYSLAAETKEVEDAMEELESLFVGFQPKHNLDNEESKQADNKRNQSKSKSKAPKSRSRRPQKWACEACTFVNAPRSATCDMCGAGQPPVQAAAAAAENLPPPAAPVAASSSSSSSSSSVSMSMKSSSLWERLSQRKPDLAKQSQKPTRAPLGALGNSSEVHV